MKTSATAVCLIILTLPAFADDTALTAFQKGNYETAIALSAKNPQTSDELAFRARAILADCIDQDSPPEISDLKQAEVLTEKALELSPHHIEARIQLAISLSLQARYMTISDARDSGYVGQSRKLAESVLEDDPGNAWANGFLSVWHVEVRRVAGPLGAAFMGASLDEAEKRYQLSVNALPGNIVLRWQYARALVALNAKKYRDTVLPILDGIEGAEAADAMDSIVISRAERIRYLMVSNDFEAAETLAISLL